jgi:cytochrome c-type biogenesis protein CcmH/NrfF
MRQPSVASRQSSAGTHLDSGGPRRLAGAAPDISRISVARAPSPATRRIVTLAFLALAVTLFAGAGDDARFNKLGHQLMCTCGCGQVLLECNHVGCTYSDRMRNELAALIDKGENDSMTLQAFVQKYGATVLAAPTTTGFNRVAWIMPFVAFAGGIALTIVLVRAWRHKKPAPVIVMPKSLDAEAVNSLRRRVHEETEL